MKYYLKLIVVSDIFMLYVAKILLMFKCTRIPQIIIKQAKINSEYIEEGL